MKCLKFGTQVRNRSTVVFMFAVYVPFSLYPELHDCCGPAKLCSNLVLLSEREQRPN